MCGITGHFSKTQLINKEQSLAMSEAIKHRGPDSSGEYFEERVFLGHRRLAIIDLSETGHQPMWDKEQEVGIVFNGEIYNYQEIKQELSEFNFVSNCDTEVIIYAYKKWGIKKAIEKFNGMFAFCLYDKKKQEAFFVRDRVGIKPFVYYVDDENFIFASELKALLTNPLIKKEINKKSVAQYFIHRYVPSPNTIIKNIHKLEAGHFLKLDLKYFQLKKIQYWKLNNKRYLNLSEQELIETAEKLLTQAVKYRLIADTEVATFLSGGIDSSLISSMTKNINTQLKAFTIDLQPPQYSEVEYAKKAAQHSNIDLIVKKISKDNFSGNFDEIIKYYDEPFADSSFVPTFLLTKSVAETGIKCALSGDGGDEVFFGYNWYATFNKVQKIKKVKSILTLLPKNLVTKLLPTGAKWLLDLLLLSSISTYRKILFDRFTVEEVNKLFNFDFNFEEDELFKQKINKTDVELSDLAFIDFNTFLVDDILYKVDIASMANGLEVRVPFLDHNLIEFMFSVSFKYLYKEQSLKYILKEISKEYLTKETIFRKKKGFSAPVMEWLDKDFKAEVLSGSLVKKNIISKEKMQYFLEHETSEGKIWQMYVFEKWVSNYFNTTDSGVEYESFS